VSGEQGIAAAKVKFRLLGGLEQIRRCHDVSVTSWLDTYRVRCEAMTLPTFGDYFVRPILAVAV